MLFLLIAFGKTWQGPETTPSGRQKEPLVTKDSREACRVTDEQLADLARRVGLGQTYADYPALVKAAAERGLAPTPALDAARTATTEPAHYFVVQADRS
jgi:hypothetical protein